MYGGYGAASPPLTNNPFVADSTSTRFPDINTPPAQSQWIDPAFTSGGYPQQQQQGMYQQYPQQQQQPMQQYQTGYMQQQQQPQQQQGPGYTQGFPQQSPSVPFQPTSSFGQQMAAHVSGSSYGYLQPQQQQQQNGYHPVQQQLQNNPGYIAQFDPYGPISQGWGVEPSSMSSGGSSMSTPNPISSSASTSSTTSSHIHTPSNAPGGYSATGDPHPREYIRTHKGEIEAWDTYAWKQLLGAFEALKGAWEVRKREVSQRVAQLGQQLQAGYFNQQMQQDGARLQGMMKEADANFDSVAASTFQMQEVFQGYRQSGDMASKRRVREATNAALQSLPNWPQPF